jgi:hypothetical protein
MALGEHSKPQPSAIAWAGTILEKSKVQTINRNQHFGHNGSSRGVNGDLEMCLDSTYTVVALANVDRPAAEQVLALIVGRLAANLD